MSATHSLAIASTEFFSIF